MAEERTEDQRGTESAQDQNDKESEEDELFDALMEAAEFELGLREFGEDDDAGEAESDDFDIDDAAEIELGMRSPDQDK